jgi:hypothetical protein
VKTFRKFKIRDYFAINRPEQAGKKAKDEFKPKPAIFAAMLRIRHPGSGAF